MYLKPNVVIEPLVSDWYAWPHLISPTTEAMNITGRHNKIMNSFIKSPKIHEAAIKNPKMLGGPFIDYKVDRLDDIKALLQHTLQNRAKAIALSDQINALDNLLKESGKGYSLEKLYQEIPELLKGYVELVYDLNDNPSFRFYESLIYEEFYDDSNQSIALWITENDERPFCLSTPRLEDDKVLKLQIPFSSNAIDELSKMKRSANSIEDISRQLNVAEKDMELFQAFFTETAPPEYQKYRGSKARMRYFGHACILIETNEVSILIDPVISYYGYESSVEHFSDCHLPDVIDYVLITHNHQDHILFETLLPLRHKIKNIIVPPSTSGALQDPNLKIMFNKIGFEKVVEIGEMETIKFKNLTITGVPFMGEHSDLNIQSKSCFHIAIGTFTFLFVADSRVLDAFVYRNVHKVLGNVDVLFLGMECDGAPLTWLYGPLLNQKISRENDNSRRLSGCDYEKGKSLVDIFNPKEVYVYAMGQEPWLEFISSIKYTPESHPIVQSDKLIEYCAQENIIGERLFGEKEILYPYEFSSTLV
ncbi:MBL fold metallo-hydrolase [Spongiimicrobium salis]|uniref:MBL fold metallo-hydrolase n=1 Tax=Spongiimicrobium salis TaxID=1667022 RepID=UPI00374D523A